MPLSRLLACFLVLSLLPSCMQRVLLGTLDPFPVLQRVHPGALYALSCSLLHIFKPPSGYSFVVLSLFLSQA